jgi:hypothetical protein
MRDFYGSATQSLEWRFETGIQLSVEGSIDVCLSNCWKSWPSVLFQKPGYCQPDNVG